MNQLFRYFISKERVNSFRELTKTLVKMAGTDEVVPEEDESVPWVPSIIGLIFILWMSTSDWAKSVTRPLMDQFPILSFGMIVLFVIYFPFIINKLDELWKQPQRKRDLQELMAIAKRAVAVLKEYDYDNLEDVIDAEVVINEYTERYGL